MTTYTVYESETRQIAKLEAENRVLIEQVAALEAVLADVQEKLRRYETRREGVEYHVDGWP